MQSFVKKCPQGQASGTPSTPARKTVSQAFAAGVGQLVGVMVTRPQPVVHCRQAVVVGQTVAVTGSTAMLVHPHAKGRAAVVCQSVIHSSETLLESERGQRGKDLGRD